jgi:DNA-binding LacI/PurR family transcriptional regulator
VGYAESMIRAGLTPVVAHAKFEQLAAPRAAATLLDPADPPTALFCYNDLTAMGGRDTAAAARAPDQDDLSIVGFDDTHAASLPGVSLTSVGQHARELGQMAGEQVVARVAHPESPPIVRMLEPTLVIRSSMAAPRGCRVRAAKKVARQSA